MIEIYTDGSCLGNPGPAGAGVVVLEDGKVIENLRCPIKNVSTNNRAEILACIIAFKWIHDHGKSDQQITVTTDSTYTKNSLTKWRSGWEKRNFRDSRGRVIKNLDYIKTLFEFYDKVNVEMQWVRGHDKCEANIMADGLAREAANIAKKKLGM